MDYQLLGKNYATDNRVFFEKEGMSSEEFAQAALENYNSNAEAAGDERASVIPEDQEANFLFGAASALYWWSA